MNITQTFILATCLIALTQVYFAASQCSNPRGFLQCMRQDADGKCEEIENAIGRRKEAGKRKMAECFTNAGCQAPSNNDESDDGGPPGMEDKKQCIEDAKERIKDTMKSQMEQCLGEDLPDDMEGPCGMGRGGPGGFMGKARKAGKAICSSYESCNNKASVKSCVQSEIDSAKQEFQRKFVNKCVKRGMRIYENFCGEGSRVDQCATSENSGCKTAFRNKKDKFCQCRDQLRSQAMSIIKSEMEQCFPRQQGIAGLLMGGVQDAMKTCFEEHMDGDLGDAADNICEQNGCPSSLNENQVRSKCEEVQQKMEAKKEEMKSCMKKNLPAFVANKIPSEEGGFLDICSAARSGGGLLGGLRGKFGIGG